MKNKFFLPIFLLFAVNNFQCTAERFKIISAREFAELVSINELKKKLETIRIKSKPTLKEYQIFTDARLLIEAHDKKIQREITELEKDEKKDYIRIRNLKAMMSDRVCDGTVELFKEKLSRTDKFFYHTRYKNPRISIIGLPLLVGGAYVVNLLKNKMELLSLEDSQILVEGANVVNLLKNKMELLSLEFWRIHRSNSLCSKCSKSCDE